jgi:hypothetical protein
MIKKAILYTLFFSISCATLAQKNNFTDIKKWSFSTVVCNYVLGDMFRGMRFFNGAVVKRHFNGFSMRLAYEYFQGDYMHDDRTYMNDV